MSSRDPHATVRRYVAAERAEAAPAQTLQGADLVVTTPGRRRVVTTAPKRVVQRGADLEAVAENLFAALLEESRRLAEAAREPEGLDPADRAALAKAVDSYARLHRVQLEREASAEADVAHLSKAEFRAQLEETLRLLGSDDDP